jgi:tetratricopeptide (TPR) repeat protein
MPQISKRIKIPYSIFLIILLVIPSLSRAANLRDMYETAVDAYNKEEYDRSIKIYEQINKEYPQFAPAYIGLGLALKEKGADIEEVLYYYKTAVEKDPASVQALEQLGRLYYSIGQLNKAQVSFEKALKINANMPGIKQTLGWINLVGKKTNAERAIIYFQDVIKTSPNPNAYFGLGIAYFTTNQREKALEVITYLKSIGQDDFASKLEKSVRENRKVIVDNFSEDGEIDQDKNVFDKTADTPKGIQVRLRGKLDEL